MELGQAANDWPLAPSKPCVFNTQKYKTANHWPFDRRRMHRKVPDSDLPGVDGRFELGDIFGRRRAFGAVAGAASAADAACIKRSQCQSMTNRPRCARHPVSAVCDLKAEMIAWLAEDTAR
jgi:hypothetical protein